MALDKTSLKVGIKALMVEMEARDTDSKEDFADGLASLIEQFVKSGTVIVEPGISVTTSAGAGTTTSTGTGSIE